MNKLVKSDVEELVIELLEKIGYQSLYGLNIVSDGATPERESFKEVLLMNRQGDAINRTNLNILLDAREDVIKQPKRLNLPELIANNKAFQRMLTEGMKASYQKDENTGSDLVWLGFVDFKIPNDEDSPYKCSGGRMVYGKKEMVGKLNV